MRWVQLKLNNCVCNNHILNSFNWFDVSAIIINIDPKKLAYVDSSLEGLLKEKKVLMRPLCLTSYFVAGKVHEAEFYKLTQDWCIFK